MGLWNENSCDYTSHLLAHKYTFQAYATPVNGILITTIGLSGGMRWFNW